MNERTLYLNVDAADLNEALRELSTGLKARDVRERFPRDLFNDLVDAFNSGRISEGVELVSVPAGRANDLRFQVKVGGLLEKSIAALRALRSELKTDGI